MKINQAIKKIKKIVKKEINSFNDNDNALFVLDLESYVGKDIAYMRKYHNNIPSYVLEDLIFSNTQVLEKSLDIEEKIILYIYTNAQKLVSGKRKRLYTYDIRKKFETNLETFEILLRNIIHSVDTNMVFIVEISSIVTLSKLQELLNVEKIDKEDHIKIIFQYDFFVNKVNLF